MQYRKDKYGNDISILGYGCMRFTQSTGRINLAKAEREIMEAYRSGVNYYDTAYVYPGNEEALGKILAKNHIRKKIHIATKLPHYRLKKTSDMERFFSEELSRLRTDYVDYYLMHMLNSAETWERLKSLGILTWLKEKQKSGAIRQIGFSYHGGADAFTKLLDAYDWDFCQIQYNYLDEHAQAGKTGLRYAAKKGIPVIIMEPLRGGKLTNGLPTQAKRIFQKYGQGKSPAEWGLRWLWDQPEVTCVLSGMNSLEMVRENIRIASSVQAGEFGKQEKRLIRAAVKAINANLRVGCTGCRYCMPCPQNVDIPGVFAAYNRQASDGRIAAFSEYFMCTALRKNYTGPANCIGCGKCETQCPQHIKIREELSAAKKALEGPVYQIARKGAPLFMRY